MTGRINKRGARKRDQIETAQAALSHMLVSVDECILRSQQAMQRTGLVVDVLEPAVKRLVRIRSDLRLAQRALNEAWLAGQENRWEGE